MYYLRKEPYERCWLEQQENGVLIQKSTFVDEDRTLFKATDCGWMGRRTTEVKYPSCKVYMVKKLSTIMNQRQRLFEHCNEWFDVYDENGKVDIENY